MNFTHRSSQRFKDLLKALSVIAEEVEFTVNPEGLTATQMDRDHRAMFVLKMPSTAFERWDVVEEQKFTVNVDNLVKRFLKNTCKEESVEFSIDPERARLNVTLRGKTVRQKEVPILQPTDEEVPQPKVFFKTKARIIIGSLRKAISDTSLVSENVRIAVEGGFLKISATGDMGSVHNEWEKGSDDLIEIRGEDDSSATFTTSYLEKIMKAIQPLSEAATLELSTDMPMKIFPELDQGCVLDFYLAPDTPPPAETGEEAYEEPVAGVVQPWELDAAPAEVPTTVPIEVPVIMPVKVPELLPTPPMVPVHPIMLDMSVLKWIKL